MINWLKQLFSKKKLSSQSIIELQGKLQEIRLDLIEKEKIITHLKQENDRISRSVEQQIDEKYNQGIEKIFVDLSTPVTHLLTQVYLIEDAGMQVQEKDILAASKRLVQGLFSAGLETIGQLGEVVPYNSINQMALGVESTLKEGDRVVIRFVGLKYRGKILRKTLVEKIED